MSDSVATVLAASLDSLRYAQTVANHDLYAVYGFATFLVGGIAAWAMFGLGRFR